MSSILTKIFSKNEKKQDLEFLAYHDDMTKLKNKRAYEEVIEQNEENQSVLYIDVNNLKITNDTKGHEKGDKLILAISEQLNTYFKEESYRVGGDEFIVITKDTEEIILEKIEKIKHYLTILTKNNSDDLTYSASFGYAKANGSTLKELVQLAEKEMYQEKKKSKEPKEESKQAATNTTDYDALLSKQQRDLKQQINENHEQIDEERVAQLIAQIRLKTDDIRAILIASKTFDHLCILTDARSFLFTVQQMEMNVDFSYLYVLYDGGPQYYGIDEYTNEITHLFEEIGRCILERKIQTKEDLQKIKGINIFKEIYTDF